MQSPSITVNETQEDSFDAPVPSSEEREKEKDDNKDGNEEEEYDDDENGDVIVEQQRDLDLEEEDFNILTIEKVSLEVLASRMRRVMAEVIYRGEPAAIALFDVANKIVFQSTMLDVKRNTVISIIVYGLTCIICDIKERDQQAEQAEHIIMLFITKLAIKNKSMKCSDLLFQLITLVDRLYLHANSTVRAAVCRLIGSLFEESNRYSDAMREHGDNAFLFTDEDGPEEEEMIPNGVKNRWMTKLARSLMDKSPQVRTKAVTALSFCDHDHTCKTFDLDEISINELLWKSVHDVDESVRVNAARRIHIFDEKTIDLCINFIENSKDNKVRHEIIVRLASNVHLSSFSEKQRFRLVNLLTNSDSPRIQEVIHKHLVGSWMEVAGQEIVSPSIFPAPEPQHKIPDQFPSIIFEYLDPFVDSTAVYAFTKCATMRFIRQLAGEVDVEHFMKKLLDLSHKDSESVGLMRRSTFRIVRKDTEVVDPENELKKSFGRILITRCFVDVVFDVTKGRLDADFLRNRAMMFFLPDVTNFVEELITFCPLYFCEDSEVHDGCKELLLYNIFHLINRAVRYGNLSDDKVVYKRALMQLLENPKLAFSTDSISTMVTSCLDLCVSEDERDEFCDWACATSISLMVYNSSEHDKEEPNLKAAMEDKSVLSIMYLRGTTMLLSTCQHEEVKSPTNAMTRLFETIIPALLGNEEKTIQKVGLELIGYATVIDFANCEPYLNLTRYLMERDDEVLKSTGIHTLVRVIKSHGFPNTANAIFKDEKQSDQGCQDSLAKLFEKGLKSLQGISLVQIVQDCLSMLSHGKYAWLKLHCTILLIVFQKSNENFPLVNVLRSYYKTVHSDFTKLNIVLGFVKAIDIISQTNEHDAKWNVLGMTEIVCECISSVKTIGDDGEVDSKKDTDKKLFMEVELANRMVNRAVSRSSASFVRHVFTAMATSLHLECVPMEQLDKLHENLVDSFRVFRPYAGKTTQIAFKRFITHCEKVILLHEKMRGLRNRFDLKRVKSELDDLEGTLPCTSASFSERKKRRQHTNSWEEDIEDHCDSDDSFHYTPQSTRTRKRASSSIIDTPKKILKVVDEKNHEDVPEEELNLDDSFEL